MQSAPKTSEKNSPINMGEKKKQKKIPAYSILDKAPTNVALPPIVWLITHLENNTKWWDAHLKYPY